MNPITDGYLAQLHLDDLYREAREARLARPARLAGRTSARIRISTGNRLVTMGERLLRTPASQSARPC